MQLKRDTLLERGKYRILETLGRGGFGITYLAEQVMTRRKVCIKEYFPKDYYNRDADTNRVYIGSQVSPEAMHKYKEKFIKEASVLAHLKHPHIVSVYDVFEENDTAYYVMEYVEGESLNAFVKRCGALDEAKAVGYIRQIADALGYIHEQNINHLDVKPGNVMVSSDDDGAILIDFGLAKHYDAVGEQTSSTPVGISHGYAPIEQYTSGGVREFSPSTDIYGLGATLYYLVTGEVPPHATDVGEEGLPKLPDYLSHGVCQAIIKSMQYWRKDRPQSIKEFLKLLDDKIVAPVAEATIINVETKSVDESTVINVKPKQTPQPAPQPKKERKSKRGLWLGIFLFILAAVASFILFGGGSSKKEGAPKSAVVTVDTLQLNEQPKEEPKEKPKPSETKQVTKPELILESGSEVILPYDGGSGEIKYTIASEGVECHIDEKQLFHREGNALGDQKVTKPESPTKENAKTVTQPNNEIWYTSSDGKVVKPTKNGKDIFGAEIESNTYKNGKGIIKFKGNVTTIGERAFSHCESLTSVTIPNSVTEIGGDAFAGCRNLKEFKGRFAFSDGRCLIINGKLVAFAPAGITKFTIPDSVTTIGESAFSYCISLTSVTIPNSVTTIEQSTFLYCRGLTSVTIPNSVTTIGGYAFNGCDSLKSVTIPNSVKTIGEYAFNGCSSLTSITIPNSVTTIGGYAFNCCISLTSVTILNGVKTIGYGVFEGCKNITSVTIPNSVTTIGDFAFSFCKSLTSVTIPNSVTTIGDGAFKFCDNLTSVTIPDSVKTIGTGAFAYCNNLSEKTKKRIKKINRNAF